jgi:hypothetical protein
MRHFVVFVAVTTLALRATSVLGGWTPSYNSDANTPKNCNYWFDNSGDYPCMAIPFLAEITPEQYLAWVSGLLYLPTTV